MCRFSCEPLCLQEHFLKQSAYIVLIANSETQKQFVTGQPFPIFSLHICSQLEYVCVDEKDQRSVTRVTILSYVIKLMQ